MYVAHRHTFSRPRDPSVMVFRVSHVDAEKDQIDKKTLEIVADEERTVYKDMDSLADDLPDNVPRFVLLSYPMQLVSSPSAKSEESTADW